MFDSIVRDKAKELGFDLVGIARADQSLERDFAAYEAFIDSGKHGEMGYLANNRELRRRIDSDGILGSAKSVICLGQRYAVEGTPDLGIIPWVARYARGRDYHNHLRKRLRKLAEFVRSLAEGTTARAMCDTAPVLERAWASLSGIGFIGKNGMLIAPGLGSFVLLGEVVTSLDLSPDQPLENKCGKCTRCIDACPSGAIVAPHVIDARRCISYLTIEHRGPYDQILEKSVGKLLFGCDICQDVCPFNRGKHTRIGPGSEYDPLPALSNLDREQLLGMSDEEISKVFQGSAMRRAKPEDWRRNVRVSLANDEGLGKG